MNRSSILTKVGLALALAAAVPACVVQAQGRVRTRGAVVITEAPPAPQEETIVVKSGYVWVRGRWDWQGSWVWVPGHYERERAGKAWADGRWEQRNNNWVWVEGEWTTRVAGDHGTVVVHEDNGHGNDGRVKVEDHRHNDGGGTAVVVVNDGRPRQPPPEPRAENQGNKKGYVWITGRWDWQNANWEWVPGHWERAKAKHHWRSGEWRLDGDVYIWVDGGWEAEEDTGRVKVRDHR